MKELCEPARVLPSKVFPHNLRYLFARCFYERERDLVRLADYLGHSSIETTRRYTMITSEEACARELELGLAGNESWGGPEKIRRKRLKKENSRYDIMGIMSCGGAEIFGIFISISSLP